MGYCSRVDSNNFLYKVEFNTPLDYYATKTDALLDLGVHKVIWIFTDARKVMVAERAVTGLRMVGRAM